MFFIFCLDIINKKNLARRVSETMIFAIMLLNFKGNRAHDVWSVPKNIITQKMSGEKNNKLDRILEIHHDCNAEPVQIFG